MHVLLLYYLYLGFEQYILVMPHIFMFCAPAHGCYGLTLSAALLGCEPLPHHQLIQTCRTLCNAAGLGLVWDQMIMGGCWTCKSY